MRKPAFLFATAAVAWGAAFLAWSLLGTAYSSVDSSGNSSGGPLAHAGDPLQVALAALPLLVALVAWLLLHRVCATGASPRSATAVALAVGGFTILSAASIGLFLAPLAILIGVAAATVEQPPRVGRA
jgi:hypothetical protein